MTENNDQKEAPSEAENDTSTPAPAASDSPDKTVKDSEQATGVDLDQYDIVGESDWQITWRQFRKNSIGMASLIIVYSLFALAIFAPLIASELPLYMRGVVTVFYDSDVTAWRDLSNKYATLSESLKTSANASLETRQQLRFQKRQKHDQIVEVLSRIFDTLPESALKTTGELKSKYLNELNKAVNSFDQKAFNAAQLELDDTLSELSYLLIYKKATGIAIDLEQGTLAKLSTTQEDFVYALDDGDDELAEDLKSTFGVLSKASRIEGKRLLRAYSAMKPFLNKKQAAVLASLTDDVKKSLDSIPEVPGEDDTDLVDAVDAFKSATQTIDTKLSRVSISVAKQQLPSREYYPVLAHLSATEVFFMLFYTLFTLCLVAVFTGAFPRPSPGSVIQAALVPSVVLAALWWVSVPTTNPPPASYYKRFYESTKLNKIAVQRLIQQKRSNPEAEVELFDPGEVVLAPLPFGENENITSDAKVPPTWAETSESITKRLLSTSERRANRTRFMLPSHWVKINDKGAAVDNPGKLVGAGLYRVPSHLNRDGDASVKVFSLKNSTKIPSIAETTSKFNAWFNSRVQIEFADQISRKLNPRVRDRLIGVRGADVECLQFRGPKTTRCLVRITWKKSMGLKDGPWGLEFIAGNATADFYISEFFKFVRSATHQQRDAIRRRLAEPIHYHWLGTDENGRDIAARMVYGSRVSLSVGFVAVGIYVFLGIFFGSLAGYFGGWIDMLISRFIEVVICFPSFFLIITVLAMFPPSIFNIMFVIGITRWTGVARLIRGEFLRLVKLDFVIACKALGLSPMRTIFRHIVPNALAPVLVAATFGVAGAILTESALSFLGFGVPQPQASWGSILQESRADPRQLWWITVFPGLAIFITITAYNIVGEAFRDASDPKLRK